MDASPFHADERAAQQLAGVRPPSASGIRTFMPDQHREFFASQRSLFVSVPGDEGWPVATMLTGPAGFVSAPSPTALRVGALPFRCDPAANGFQIGNDIGILGLDLATRRRNRANGRIAALGSDGFTVAVAQSFGNCAQYIQTRTILAEREVTADALSIAVAGIDADARKLIAASDTFFVASRSRVDGTLDISHRGGRPGFVRGEGNVLTIPDFNGNRFFNTLGNLFGDDRAGLLFVDFDSGDLLQAIGRVTIDWVADPTRSPRGAQRSWRVEIARSWWRRRALPFVWAFGDYAPMTLATGVW
jgi:predicted pyridoxine 5'-phosphate oxidase superfamily flavin-nucleotide-binding protein